MTFVRPWHSWSRNQHPENLTPIENLARADRRGHESRQTKVNTLLCFQHKDRM